MSGTGARSGLVPFRRQGGRVTGRQLAAGWSTAACSSPQVMAAPSSPAALYADLATATTRHVTRGRHGAGERPGTATVLGTALAPRPGDCSPADRAAERPGALDGMRRITDGKRDGVPGYRLPLCRRYRHPVPYSSVPDYFSSRKVAISSLKVKDANGSLLVADRRKELPRPGSPTGRKVNN